MSGDAGHSRSSAGAGKVTYVSNAITARWPGTTMRLVPALATAVALAITLVTVSACGQGEDLTKGPEVPAVGSPTPPVCPASVTDDVAPTNTRKGPLVPSGATEALLCSYRFAAPEPAPLTATHRLTTGAAEVVAYLNGLSTSQPEGAACVMSGVTQHVVVVGYADRPAAVVYAHICGGWEQAGAVRYGGDIRTVTAFWGVPWNQ